MDDAMENKINQEMENNNNENKRHSSKYEDMTGSRGFRIGSLIPPEASYANADSNTNSKVVELDDDGNELGELPQLPPKRLLSRYMSLPVEDEEHMGDLIPSPGVEEEQICLSPGTPDDVDGGYLEPQTGHLYEEIKEVKRMVEVTPTGSRIFTVEERTRKVPLMRRLTSRMSRKNTIDSDDENIKCTCSKKNLLLVAIFIAIVLLLVIAIVVAVMITRDKKSEPKTAAASTGFAKDVIYPELTCPRPATVILSDYSMAVTLSGADARDNVGIASLEYVPQLVDDSANYETPYRLILSRSSIGRNYSVLVKATDIGGNEAECRYSVAVKGDPCVPWKLPPAAFSTRTEEKTSQGWKVTYQCQGHSSGTDQKHMVPHPLSYHYLDSRVVFTCSIGSEFIPNRSFSCQNPSPALYSYVTSLNYQYLDRDGSKLQNITKEKAKDCFERYYKDKVIGIQETLSEHLQEDIIDAASRNSKNLSTMELKSSVADYPQILNYDANNGRIQAMNIGLGYQVGPPGQVFPTSSLNVFVKGVLRREHNNLFMESMLPFSRLKGNVNAGCPDIRAPPDSSIFNEVSSEFSCNEGEKKHIFYDDHLNSDVTVCLGCPVGEYYNTESCEECPLNTYQDIVGAMECKLCPLNKKTETTGARSLQECVPM